MIRRSPLSPQPVMRPSLARWMFERDLKLKDATAPLGVQTEQVRRYCLPFDDPMRCVPTPKVMARIIAWTGGAVRADDFYTPHIRGEPDLSLAARPDASRPDPLAAQAPAQEPAQ